MTESLIEIMSIIFVCGIFFGIPLASVVWFIVSLVRLKRLDKATTDTYLYKKRRRSCIISCIVAVVLVLAHISLLVILALGISNM